MQHKIYIIAGEASGDLHGSNLVKALLEINPNLVIKGWGGAKLIEAGVDVQIRYEQASFMGFVEVFRNIFQILDLFKQTKKAILDFSPDALLLVDYPGFNLRMSQWAFKKNIPVYYYISPQIWAWKEGRVEIIKRTIKKMFVILPFEKAFYAKHNYQVYYEGHPLISVVKSFSAVPNFRINHSLDNRSIIALFPGSRKQEISKMLPLFLEAVKSECKYQVVIAGLSQHESLYKEILLHSSTKATIVYTQNYSLLKHSKFALVTSGTATLETALFNIPQIVCYKGGNISYQIAKRLVKIPYISLVNLILNKSVVVELIQGDCIVDRIKLEIQKLKDPHSRHLILQEYKLLQHMLGNGSTSANIAQIICADLK